MSILMAMETHKASIYQKNSSRLEAETLCEKNQTEKRRTLSTKGELKKQDETEKRERDKKKLCNRPTILVADPRCIWKERKNALDMNELFRFGHELLDGLSTLHFNVSLC